MLADDWISPDKYANKSFRSGRRTTGTLAAYYKHTIECNLNKLQCMQSWCRILWHVLPVNLLVYPVLLASGSHCTGYQLDKVLFTKLLWLHIKFWKQDNWFILVVWDPPVNYYSISRWVGDKDQFPNQGIQRHGTSCLELSVSSCEKYCYHHQIKCTSEN